MGRKNLGEFEQMLLLAILRLRAEASGPAIAEQLEKRAGRRVSRGALYSSLDRLERKGFVRWEVESVASEQGGAALRRFEVTPAGLAAVREAYGAWVGMTSGLEDLLGKA